MHGRVRKEVKYREKERDKRCRNLSDVREDEASDGEHYSTDDPFILTFNNALTFDVKLNNNGA